MPLSVSAHASKSSLQLFPGQGTGKGEQWLDVSQLKPWQIDVLSRYVPSSTSDEEYAIASSKSRRKIKIKKRTVKRNRGASKIDPQEFDDFIAANEELWTAFVMYKLKHVARPEQDFLPRTRFSNFWNNVSDKEDSEKDEKKSQPSKESFHFGNLTKQVNVNKTSKPNILNNQNIFFISNKNQASIDSFYSNNYIRLLQQQKCKEDCKMRNQFKIAPDCARLRIAYSLKDMLRDTLSKFKEKCFLHRITYAIAFDGCAMDMKKLFCSYIHGQKLKHAFPIRLTGCIIFYREGLAIIMLECEELQMVFHFSEFYESNLMDKIKVGKIFSIETFANKRYLKYFSCCLAKPLPTEPSSAAPAVRILKSIQLNLYKLYNKMRKVANSNFSLFQPEGFVKKYLPTLNEVVFILKYPPLRNLESFIKTFTEIPQVSDSSDDEWPARDTPFSLQLWSDDELAEYQLDATTRQAKLRRLQKELGTTQETVEADGKIKNYLGSFEIDFSYFDTIMSKSIDDSELEGEFRPPERESSDRSLIKSITPSVISGSSRGL